MNDLTDQKVVSLVCDGGLIGPRNPSKFGGTYAYILLGDDCKTVGHQSGLVLPEWIGCPEVTNNHTELVAMLFALEALPDGWAGIVMSDSQITLGRFFWGWKFNNVPEFLIERVGVVIRRIDATRCIPVLLDGHPTKAQLASGKGKRGHPVSIFNCYCDKACQTQARRFLESLNG